VSGTFVNLGDDLSYSVTTFISLDVVGRSEVLSNEFESVLCDVETIGAVGEHHDERSSSSTFLAVTVDAETSTSDSMSAVEEESSDLIGVTFRECENEHAG